MKSHILAALSACAVLLSTACDKPRQETSAQVAEAERRADEAIARQQELELQIEQQRLAAEADAIERERMDIEAARVALEQEQADAATAEMEYLRQREEEIARREGAAMAREAELARQTADLDHRGADLSDREFELAGREAFGGDKLVDDAGGPVADHGVFYDSLASYGSWFQTPDYGYVWQPVVLRQVTDWRPYTRGRWVCTDYGWTWVSNEPFGWATYHYGRWALLGGVGWVWVPGSVWAPAWVTWRSGGDYIGWAPLPPETMAWRNRDWGSSVEVSFGIGSSWFSFVDYHHFGGPIHSQYLPYRHNATYIQQTTNITHIHVHQGRVVNGGPKYNDLSRRIGKRLPFYRLDLDRRGRPGRDPSATRHRFAGNRLRVVAPDVDADWNSALRPARVERNLESVQVERTRDLQPEIVNQFRESRRQNRERAEQVIAESGGRESFNRKRMEILQTNRRDATRERRAPARPETPPARDAQADATRERRAPARPETPPARDAQADATRERRAPARPETPPARDAQADATRERRAPARPETPPARDAQADAGNPATRDQKPEAPTTRNGRTGGFRQPAEQERRTRETQQTRQQTESSRSQIEEARRQQQQQAKELAQRQQEESRLKQVEDARQQQQQAKELAQRQQEESRRRQVEEARQQQQQAKELAQRQQEESHRRQIEEARRQQQQAQEQAQRMQEESHRNQIEEARRQQQQQAQEQAQRQHQEQSQRAQQRQAQEQRQQQESRQRAEDAEQRGGGFRR